MDARETSCLGDHLGRSLGRDLSSSFRATLALCSPRGKRHILEQMKKNEEERSLQAEHREQEKEQMLAYLERLQEEDLQVTDKHQVIDAAFPQHQQQNPPRFQGSGYGVILLFPHRAYTHFTTPSPSAS